MSFRRVGSGLEGVVADWIDDPDLAQALVVQAWRRVAGETAASHTRVLEITDGVLRVHAHDATWERSLQGVQERLLQGLRDALGRRAPRRIEWV